MDSDSTLAERKLAYVDLAIALVLDSWTALAIAVQNSWGGPDSAGKREWLAGVLSDLFKERPETDEQDVEDVLCQVMADEFDLQIDDESEVQIAADICRYRRHCLDGNFTAVEELRRRWEARGGASAKPVAIQRGSNQQDDDSSEDDDEDGGVDVDVDMDGDDAPQLVSAGKPKVLVEPEVDEDGFTKVVSKKKR